MASRNNLPRIKDGAYVINLDDKSSRWTYYVLLLIDKHITAYFDSFGIKYITQELLNKIKDINCSKYIFVFRFNCIAFIEHACRKKLIRLYKFIFSE